MKFIDEFCTMLKKTAMGKINTLLRKLELWNSLKGTFMKFPAIQFRVIKT